MDQAKIAKLNESLRKIYEEEKKRIVFWFDAGQEFEDSYSLIELQNVTIINLTGISALELKIRLETNDGRYLLYAPFAEPEPEKDWLMDIRLYSRTFYADMASIALNELQLTNLSMRTHIEKRIEFFKNKDRVEKLKKWVIPGDLENELDLKMLAAVLKADQPESFNILIKLFSKFCKEGICDLSQQLKEYEDIRKYGLECFFWDLMAKLFGYTEAEPNLMDLAIRIFVADLGLNMKTDLPWAMLHFKLLNKALSQSASVFLSQWRSNVPHFETYKLIAKKISDELNVEEHIKFMDKNILADVITFEAVEQRIIRSLRDSVLEQKYENIEDVKSLILKRLDGFWANKRFGSDDGSVDTYYHAYKALEFATELFELRKEYESGFSFENAEKMFTAYKDNLYRFDWLYRKFNIAADNVEIALKDGLKSLREAVEDCYGNWYMEQLAMVWGTLIESDGEKSLLKRWAINDVNKQQNFYVESVKRLLDKSSGGKIFVIISDAMRYEAAQELAKELSSKNRFKVTIDAQLGVLPGYTGLGMAALLPHKILSFKMDTNADVLVDGQSAASTEQRAKILAGYGGTLIKTEDLLAMKREDGREFAKKWNFIYIYHNRIDAAGDNVANESETFQAVEKTIEELSALVSHIINNLNGSQVLITSDHGFLYQNTPANQLDKSVIQVKPQGILKDKKRYILGKGLGDAPNVWHGETSVTAGAEGGMEFWIPKGANRFHFVGGSRFIHGGAMLQEIVVPVITVKELSGREAKKAVTGTAGVSLLGANKKLVTPIHRFEFIQNEAVSERMKPRTLVFSIYDGQDLISNEETLTFDSASNAMEERKRTAKLTLKAGQYSSRKEYYLVLRNADTNIEYDRYTIIIDIAISNDF